VSKQNPRCRAVQLGEDEQFTALTVEAALLTLFTASDISVALKEAASEVERDVTSEEVVIAVLGNTVTPPYAHDVVPVLPVTFTAR